MVVTRRHTKVATMPEPIWCTPFLNRGLTASNVQDADAHRALQYPNASL
jgi:hypothetical protein